MTQAPYYPPTASTRSNGDPAAAGPVFVAVAGPAPQRRITVAFRIILAIPHFVVLYVLGLAAPVVMVIGWFGALFTGYLPRFAATYLTSYLGWYCRIGAYLLLLTDVYPPFAYDDSGYPVRVAVSPGKLSRLAVLFRLILAIPAAIAVGTLSYGVSTFVIFIAWLIALVAGRLPVSLHQALASVLRYTTRYSCYVYLLTDVYPAGLFGDQPRSPVTAEPPPGPGYGHSYGAPAGPGFGVPNPGYGPQAAGYGTPGAGYGEPGYGMPGYGAPVPPYGAAGDDRPAFANGTPAYGPPGYGPFPVPGYPAPAAGAAGQYTDWQLVLTAGAKRLVVLILVLGLLAVAGEGASMGLTISAAIQRDRQINQLNADITQHNNAVARYNDAATRERQAANQVNNAIEQLTAAQDSLASALNSPAADSDNCATVSCFNTTAVPVVHAFAAFGRTLQATPVPTGSAAIEKRLVTDTAGNEQDWTQITQAGSFGSIEDIATGAEKVGGQFDNDYAALVKSLNQQSTTLDNQATALDGQAAELNQAATTLEQRAAALNVPVSVQTAEAPSQTSA